MTTNKYLFSLLKNYISLLFIALSVVLNACSERYVPNNPYGSGNGGVSLVAPVAQFSYQIQQPLSVAFTNSSSNNPSKTTWDFGDGSTSSEYSPIHKYAEAGSYLVTLTVYNSAGTSNIRKNITINTPKVYVSGVKYIRVGKENNYYRALCKDDDFFTTTWWKTTYTPLLDNKSLPYSFNFSSPILMDGLEDDEYYTVYIYWNTKTNGDGTQILKQKIYTSSIYKYPSEIILTSDNKDTQVAVMFSYK